MPGLLLVVGARDLSTSVQCRVMHVPLFERCAGIEHEIVSIIFHDFCIGNLWFTVVDVSQFL